MPVKFVIVGALVTTAVAIAIYENREPIRRKLAESLHKLADAIEARRHDHRHNHYADNVPLHHRHRPSSSSSSETVVTGNPFDDPPAPPAQSSALENHRGELRARHGAGTAAIATGAAVVAVGATVATIAAVDESEEIVSESGYQTAVPSLSEQERPTTPTSDGEGEQLWSSIQSWQAATEAPQSASVSLAGSAPDELEVEGTSDSESEFGGSLVESVGSWTEVASEFSDEMH